MDALQQPIVQAGLLIGLMLLAVFYFVARGGKARDADIPGLRALVERGELEHAGDLAARYGRLEEAIDYFLRAGKPARAAELAVRMSDARRAATLYQQAGETERAAFYHDQAKLTQGAGEDHSQRPFAPSTPAAEEPQSTAADRAPEPESHRPADSLRRGGASTPDPSPTTMSPIRGSQGSDGLASSEAQELAAEEAERQFTTGDLEGAARTYREAGLYEEAINLYVNVLGKPGEAATLFEKLGNTERAEALRAARERDAEPRKPPSFAPPAAPPTVAARADEFAGLDDPIGAVPSPRAAAVAASSPPPPVGFGAPAHSPGPVGEQPGPGPSAPPPGFDPPGTHRRSQAQAGHATASYEDRPAASSPGGDRTVAQGAHSSDLVAQARAAYAASPAAKRKRGQQAKDDGEPPPPGEGSRSRFGDAPSRGWSPPKRKR